MNKIIIALIGLISVGSLCFAADQGAMASKPKVSSAADLKMASGTVDAVNLTDPAKSEIIIKGADNNKLTFLATSAIVTDANAKAITLSQIKTGENIKVKYSIKNGINEASMIALTK